MYPVKMTDPTTFEEFETEIDLSKLKTKDLTVQPDENNEFSLYYLEVRKKLSLDF